MNYHITYLSIIIPFLLFLSKKDINRLTDESSVAEGNPDSTYIDYFYLDIFSRKSDYFEGQNLFLRFFPNPSITVDTSRRFSIESELELISSSLKLSASKNYEKGYSSKMFFTGRNHLNLEEYNKWNHYYPTLYDFQYRLSESIKNIQYKRKVKIGIRDVREHGGTLLINNTKYRLKSIELGNTNSNTFDHDYLITLKKLYFNTLILRRLPDKTLLNLSDQLGIYIIIDLRDTSISQEEIRTYIKTQNFHTSYIAWITDDPEKKNVIEHIDKSRPVLEVLPKNSFYRPIPINELESASMKKAVFKIFQPFKFDTEYHNDSLQAFTLLKIIPEDQYPIENADLEIIISYNENEYSTSIDVKGSNIDENRFIRIDTERPLEYASAKSIEYNILVKKPFLVFQPNDTLGTFVQSFD